MTRATHLLVAASIVLLAVVLTAQGQGLDPSAILKPLSDSWPTNSGDYSGKRYSSLTQINQSNVKNLTLAWVSKFTGGPGNLGGAGRGGFPFFGGGAPPPTIIGGEGSMEPAGTGFGSGTDIRCSILEVNGILYLSTPDNAWAVDA